MSFVKNAWYAAAASDEVGRDILTRTILGDAMVFYRTEDGAPVAVEDRCIHKRAPLSLGRLTGDNIECGYHGLTFDPAGACVHIPGQETIPPGACVRAFPVVDRHGWVWVWPGEAAAADDALIPDMHWNVADGWTSTGGLLHLNGEAALLTENLLDLSHLTFVHTRTIGTQHVADAQARTERTDGSVRVIRDMPDVDAPPLWQNTEGFGRVNRWQNVDYLPPTNVVVDTGFEELAAAPGKGAPRRVALKIINLITPETEKSAHYFWAQVHDYPDTNDDLQKVMHHHVEATLIEDVDIIERQQQTIDADSGAPETDINVDAGPLEMRRILARMIAAEAAA